MHVSHIVQAGYSAGSDASALDFCDAAEASHRCLNVLQAVGTSIIEIDKLANRADEDVLIKGTAYDIYCWAKARLPGSFPAGDFHVSDAMLSTSIHNHDRRDCLPTPTGRVSSMT